MSVMRVAQPAPAKNGFYYDVTNPRYYDVTNPRYYDVTNPRYYDVTNPATMTSLTPLL